MAATIRETGRKAKLFETHDVEVYGNREAAYFLRFMNGLIRFVSALKVESFSTGE